MVALSMAAAQSFEVASIKPFKDEGTGPRNGRTSYERTGIEVRARTLGFLIGEAYGFPPGRIVPPEGKNEILTALRQGYDISAKTDRAVSREELKAMMQTLLTERFGLKLHRESRNELVYRLVAAKGGAKVQDGDGGELAMSGSADGYTFRNAEMFRLCGYLGSFADRVVVDETGLKGLYNYTVKTPEDLRRGGGVVKMDGKSPESSSSAAFAEVLRPLGLQLVGGKANVEYIVVDRVGRLAEN
jgi:uncharacterized protein (TIGR03435 family)